MKIRLATAASIIALGFAMPAMAQSSDSDVTQFGTANIADVDQIGVDANNVSTINQGVLNNSSNDNSATVIQDGTQVLSNDSTVDQDGSNNTALVTQGGSGSGGDTNLSTIDQDGTGNGATVTQGDLITDNDSSVVQDGTDNSATVDQGGVGNINQGPNNSTVDQIGFGNIATVSQGGDGAVNTSDIDQDGAGLGGINTASVTQGGSSDNDSGIIQSGTLNDALVTQNSAASVINTSDISQTGTGNMATVSQH